ncbi:superoxide dismutase family protein [Pseudalkalibacillus sp. SCS-8]|uniref:superoxide dismutase family protein n=1 Tax=Pseudalkalibacillus nanhaiensis TaxID=3115291 RepID=UPI0032DA19AF
MYRWKRSSIALLFAASTLTACGYQNEPTADRSVEAEPVQASRSVNKSYKTVEMYNQKEEKIGEAQISETPKGVMIQLKVSNLSPGVHGYHIHETGKCDAPDFKSAGEHYNPVSKEHGFHNPKGYHAGDLPNLEVDEDGMVAKTTYTKHVTLQKGAANTLLDEDGSALVIHAKADDYKTNPSGDSGERIACGVIK